MDRKNLLAVSCTGLLTLALSEPVPAVEVYQWVDQNGVTHFSQFAPPGSVADVSKRTLVDDAPEVDPAEDRYAVEQTAKDMQAYRDEMDQKRERRRQQQANTPAPIVVQHYNEAAYPWWLTNYPHRPVRPPDWRPDRPGGGPGSGNGPRPAPVPQPRASTGFRKPGG